MYPLEGRTILDLTTVLMGPYATRMLESPEGDIIRQIGPSRTRGMGAMFLNVNRGKRSIAIDFENPEARDALLKLARRADALVYNMRLQAMMRLSLYYETLAVVNPRIVYDGLFGYGQSGAPRMTTWIHSLTCCRGRQRLAVVRALTKADRIFGLMGASAILGALMHQQRSDLGQRGDVTMFESMAEFVLVDHLGGLTYEPPLDDGGYARLLSPSRIPYKTSYGHICALNNADKHGTKRLQLQAANRILRLRTILELRLSGAMGRLKSS
jgi:crotonobetainyl-CoA:carnitine CoA-transferase CaiB-like acyl-CoA transferase